MIYNHKIKLNEYSKLNDIPYLTGLSIRMAKYKMKKVKEKYKNKPDLLFKKNNRWYIHYTILHEFGRERKSKKKAENAYQKDWKIFGNYSIKDKYSVGYHQEIMNTIKAHFKDDDFYIVVGENKRKINHVHFLTTSNNLDRLNTIMKSVFHNFYSLSDVRIFNEKLKDKYRAMHYLEVGHEHFLHHEKKQQYVPKEILDFVMKNTQEFMNRKIKRGKKIRMKLNRVKFFY